MPSRNEKLSILLPHPTSTKTEGIVVFWRMPSPISAPKVATVFTISGGDTVKHHKVKIPSLSMEHKKTGNLIQAFPTKTETQ